MIDQTSDSLLRDLLEGNNDPWMFHQANTRDYDGGGHSLLSDLLTATFDKYAAVATLPIVSPTMDDLAARVINRMAWTPPGSWRRFDLAALSRSASRRPRPCR